jgi:hypothetical protein
MATTQYRIKKSNMPQEDDTASRVDTVVVPASNENGPTFERVPLSSLTTIRHVLSSHGFRTGCVLTAITDEGDTLLCTFEDVLLPGKARVNEHGNIYIPDPVPLLKERPPIPPQKP